ncbi:MAG: NAD(P)H-dependent oxidoreductase [Actinobacteria bacterium]|nr:NAD(P)H-dependent oxidoreductase [Actinomycetota bacterium]
MTHRIVVVSAGLRTPSSTTLLADSIAAQLRSAFDTADAQVSTTHIEVRDHAHAIVDALMVGFPTGALADALDEVTGADALVVVTPTFSATFSGLFKAFFDLIEPGSLRGMPVLLAATGGTERHSLMLDHALRPLFTYLGLSAVRTGVFAATSDFGTTAGASLTARITTAAVELRDAVLSRGHVARQDESTSVTPFAELLKGSSR